MSDFVGIIALFVEPKDQEYDIHMLHFRIFKHEDCIPVFIFCPLPINTGGLLQKMIKTKIVKLVTFI